MKSFPAALCALTFVLAACSSEPAPAPEAEPAAPAETKSGEYTLSPVNDDETAAANLSEETACTFENEQGLILIAKASAKPTARGYGIMKINGFVEKVQTSHTGGFAAMSDRGEFEGRGLKIDIETSGGALSSGDVSTFTAQMTLDRAGGEPRLLDGKWACETPS